MSEKRDFWKNEAKLGIFDPGKRMRFWLSTLGGVIAIACAIVVSEYASGLSAAVSRAIALGVSIALFPATLCYEMFHSGGEVGSRLKKQRDENETKGKDVHAPQAIKLVLADSANAMSDTLHWGKQHWPGGYKDGSDKEKEFCQRFKQRILDVVHSFNRRVPSSLALAVNDVEDATSYIDLKHRAEQKLKVFVAAGS